MGLLSRVMRILVTPQTEWDVIASEPATLGGLIGRYVLPLSLVAVAVGFVRMLILDAGGDPESRLGISTLLMLTATSVITSIAACVAGGFLIADFAPKFEGRWDRVQAFKLAAYSFTPVPLALILRSVPRLSFVSTLGVLYAAYLLYVGIPKLMGSPRSRAAPYVLAVAVAVYLVVLAVSVVLLMLVLSGSVFTEHPFRIVQSIRRD